ncbi:unnamed protein product [Lactuca virosa]|uniref:Uncharacterized protein n=1 Tax=Lactuca virosa TaxID=75947 RepID=A0AAU9MQT0_9ASTR|nr:unnamed protein product [Lactuca virosa]
MPDRRNSVINRIQKLFGDMDEFHENESAMQMPDKNPTYHRHTHYIQEQEHEVIHDLSNGNMIQNEDQDDIGSDPGNLSSDNHNAMMARGSIEDTNQLTLSFQGQVYVFDSVSPEKVQAVLLLLGGRETSSSMPYMSLTHYQQSNRDLGSIPQRLNVPQRLASLMRFREKRKERNFEKKIRYTVRKEVALRMQRNKGQFTSSKGVHEESAATSWDSNQGGWHSDGSGSQHQETACRHCGINEKSTPLMRRGPDGPRTLCNACGLMWANKGTLRDLSKAVAATPVGKSPSLNQRHEDENGNMDSEQMVVTGNSHDS